MSYKKSFTHTCIMIFNIQYGCRWLLKKAPNMTRISCATNSANAAWMLRILVPSLSHLIAPAAELCINHDSSMLLARPLCPHQPCYLLIAVQLRNVVSVRGWSFALHGCMLHQAPRTASMYLD